MQAGRNNGVCSLPSKHKRAHALKSFRVSCTGLVTSRFVHRHLHVIDAHTAEAIVFGLAGLPGGHL